MGDTATSAGSDTARLLVVGAVAAGAACAATSLYWQYTTNPMGSNNKKNRCKRGKTRKKNLGGAGAAGFDPSTSMSTACTSPGMATGVGPQAGGCTSTESSSPGDPTHQPNPGT